MDAEQATQDHQGFGQSHPARRNADLQRGGGMMEAASEIDLQLCYPSPKARAVDASAVAKLAESISESGLLQPITVRKVRKSRAGQVCDAFEVIAGMHRVKAFRRLGRETIPAVVTEMDDLRAELALIDENLCRNDLSPAERSAAQARRKAIYQQLHPETKAGAAGNGRSKKKLAQLEQATSESVPRFDEAAAAATGQSSATVRRDVHRGEALGEDTLAKVARTSLDKGEELDALAKLAPEVRDSLITRAASGEKVSAKTEAKQQIRANREALLGEKQRLLPQQRYGVIYADPEWRFEVYSRETGMDRSADNHYPTSATDAICARPVKDIAADDCVLFLWATAPMLPDALKVMAAWGFTYKSQTIWNKDRLGTGYWFRNKHELLLVGTRGNVPAPAMGTQWLSVIDVPVGAHSAKPDKFYQLIETYFPTLPKIELNARRARPGWDAWGNEAPIESCDPSTGEITQSEARHATPPAASPEPAADVSPAPAAGSTNSQIEAERGVATCESQEPTQDGNTQPTAGDVLRVTDGATPSGSAVAASSGAASVTQRVAGAAPPISDIDLDIPEFLRRNADNSVSSVPVASPREAQSGISGEAGG
jgi:ParB/RepB/Spo0J family partition protein